MNLIAIDAPGGFGEFRLPLCGLPEASFLRTGVPAEPWLWDARFAELQALRELPDDWDAQGAGPLDPELPSAAATLLRQLERLRVAPPDRIAVGLTGGVVLEWLTPRESVEIEVVTPLRAEGHWSAPGTLHTESFLLLR